MRQPDLQRNSIRLTPRRLAACGAAGVLALAATFALTHRAPKSPPPLDPAAVAALQNVAFTQAEAQPGFAQPETVPVQLQRGETLEGAVQRAGVAPAEAQRVVDMLGQAMDTV